MMMIKVRIVEVEVVRTGHLLTEIHEKEESNTKILVLSSWKDEVFIS